MKTTQTNCASRGSVSFPVKQLSCPVIASCVIQCVWNWQTTLEKQHSTEQSWGWRVAGACLRIDKFSIAPTLNSMSQITPARCSTISRYVRYCQLETLKPIPITNKNCIQARLSWVIGVVLWNKQRARCSTCCVRARGSEREQERQRERDNYQ